MYARPQPSERPHFDACEDLRRQLSRGEFGLRPIDGSREASSPPIRGRLLYRLIRLSAPRNVVEFGTAYGVSASYLAAALAANGTGSLTSVEGDPQRAAIAESGVEVVAPGVTRVLNQRFQDAVELLDGADFFYLDGQHRERPTKRYVTHALERMTRPALIVLDDIEGYSEEMDRVWIELCRDPRVTRAGAHGGVGVLVVGDLLLELPTSVRLGTIELTWRRFITKGQRALFLLRDRRLRVR